MTGLDFSFEMLGRANVLTKGDRRFRGSAISWVQAGAQALPFPAGCFDAVVSAYVLRNLHKAGFLQACLSEAFRVLRPSGRLLFLDLTRPKGWLLRQGHGIYLKTVVPGVGRWLFGGRWPGDYLKDSIDGLMPEGSLKNLFENAGFSETRIRPLWGGIVSLFEAAKPC